MAMSEADRQARIARLNILTRSGCTVSEAELVDDLAQQTLKKVMDSIDIVVETAPEHLRGVVFTIATKMLAVNCAYALEIAEMAMRSGLSPVTVFEMVRGPQGDRG